MLRLAIPPVPNFFLASLISNPEAMKASRLNGESDSGNSSDIVGFLSSKNDFEKKIFYILQSKDVLLNINTLEFGDGTSINLNYNKLKYVRREIKNSNLNLRVSFNCETISTEIDFRKTNSTHRL